MSERARASTHVPAMNATDLVRDPGDTQTNAGLRGRAPRRRVVDNAGRWTRPAGNRSNGSFVRRPSARPATVTVSSARPRPASLNCATRTNDLGALLSDSQKLVVSETLDSREYGKTRVSDFKASDQGSRLEPGRRLPRCPTLVFQTGRNPDACSSNSPCRSDLECGRSSSHESRPLGAHQGTVHRSVGTSGWRPYAVSGGRLRRR